jgi:hypothetical protein
VARFLAEALGGPFSPDEAGEIAAGVAATRIADGERQLSAVAAEPGGFRSLAGVLSRALARRRGTEDEVDPAAGQSLELSEPAGAVGLPIPAPAAGSPPSPVLER